MLICVAMLNAVWFIVRTVIQVVREVVTIVCELVVTVITTIKEVCEEVCGWLGWFSWLCDWVCKLIAVVEVTVDWVCEEVIERIVDWVEILLVYTVYVLTWVCWFVDWIPRFFDLLVCLLGIKPKKYLRLCVKVLTDEEGNGATTLDGARQIHGRAAELFKQCNIGVILTGVEFIRKPEYLTGTRCGLGGLFSRHHLWFNDNACPQPPFSFVVPVTVFFVDSMDGSNACSIPGTNYVVLTDGANGASLAHEIGHLSALTHHDDSQNIMFAAASDTKDQFARYQCCMIRSSQYATLTGRIAVGRIAGLQG